MHSAARPRVTKGSIANMVRLEGGVFRMGTSFAGGFPEDGEGPVRDAQVDALYFSKYPVTNELFAEFVSATAYKTEAERFGWSFVFYQHLPPDQQLSDANRVVGSEWWRRVEGADWAHPEGPWSSANSRPNHPAVQISWNDAMAYCEWAGVRLPTEAEWEYAARGGLDQGLYPWGDELTPEGKHLCNIWQGKFPETDLAEDGYSAVAPADVFPPNGYGLFTITGNAWEWCADWFSATHHTTATRSNPVGPLGGSAKVIKGGSYLCHESYCNRYRVAARTSNTPDSATTNIGFRVVRDI